MFRIEESNNVNDFSQFEVRSSINIQFNLLQSIHISIQFVDPLSLISHRNSHKRSTLTHNFHKLFILQ